LAHLPNDKEGAVMFRRIVLSSVMMVLLVAVVPATGRAADPVLEWGEPHVFADAPLGSPVAIAGAGYVTVDAHPLRERADASSSTIHFSPDGWSWRQVMEPPSTRLSSVAAGGPGFVAVGREGVSEFGFVPAVWASANGIDWDQVPFTAAVDRPATAEGPPFTGSWMEEIVATRNGLVAIGEFATATPTAWTSPDGLTWTELPAGSFGPDPAHLWLLATDGTTIAAVGRTPSEGDSPGGALAWWSTDGLDWNEATIDPSFGTGFGPLMSRLLALDSGYMLFGTDDGHATVWSSADGRTWGSPLLLPSVLEGNYSFVGEAATDGAVVVAVGDEFSAEPTFIEGATIWAYAASSGWTQTSPAQLQGPVTLDHSDASQTYPVGSSWVVLGGTWGADEEGHRIRWIGQRPGSGPFADVPSDYLFAGDIEWLHEQGVTKGCNPPANDLFCPTAPLTRGQAAAMLVRAKGYTDDGGGDLFVDDDSSVFEPDIDRLGAAGVTRGCNPPANDRFCPDDHVTRGQMAALFGRALSLGVTPIDFFIDDDSSIFEDHINRLAAAGVTRGCNPPGNDRFCPSQTVTREQMAAFLKRGLSVGA
jgi:hypothetical protein